MATGNGTIRESWTGPMHNIVSPLTVASVANLSKTYASGFPSLK
jgi:hypothetical protein